MPTEQPESPPPAFTVDLEAQQALVEALNAENERLQTEVNVLTARLERVRDLCDGKVRGRTLDAHTAAAVRSVAGL